MNVSEIDLDSLIELDLWELQYRVERRLARYAGEHRAYHRGELGTFESCAARDRMKALV